MGFMIERAVLGGTAAKGAARAELNPGITALLRGGSSELDPTLRAVTAIQPEITGVTLDAATVLAGMFSGKTIPHIVLSSGSPAYVYLQIADDVTRGTAGANIVLKVTEGIVVPRRLFGQDGVAALEYAIHARYGGTNVPVQRLAAQNLAGGSAAATSLTRLHAIKDNATTLKNIADWSLDFGIEVSREMPASSYYPTITNIIGYAPTLEFNSTALETILGTYGFAGAIAGAAGLLLYLGVYDSTGFVDGGAAAAYTLALRTGSPIVPVSIPLGEGVSRLSLRAWGLGGTDQNQPPLAWASGATLPTHANAHATEQFITGPASDGSYTFEITGGEVNFGLGDNLRTRRRNTLLWPDAWVVDERTPNVRINSRGLSEYLLNGGASVEPSEAIDTALNVYFRGLTPDSEAYADASAEHVKVTIANGRLEPGNLAGDHSQDALGDVVVTAVNAGTMLAIATGVAIT